MGYKSANEAYLNKALPYWPSILTQPLMKQKYLGEPILYPWTHEVQQHLLPSPANFLLPLPEVSILVFFSSTNLESLQGDNCQRWLWWLVEIMKYTLPAHHSLANAPLKEGWIFLISMLFIFIYSSVYHFGSLLLADGFGHLFVSLYSFYMKCRWDQCVQSAVCIMPIYSCTNSIKQWLCYTGEEISAKKTENCAKINPWFDWHKRVVRQ